MIHFDSGNCHPSSGALHFSSVLDSVSCRQQQEMMRQSNRFPLCLLNDSSLFLLWHVCQTCNQQISQLENSLHCRNLPHQIDICAIKFRESRFPLCKGTTCGWARAPSFTSAPMFPSFTSAPMFPYLNILWTQRCSHSYLTL